MSRLVPINIINLINNKKYDLINYKDYACILHASSALHLPRLYISHVIFVYCLYLMICCSCGLVHPEYAKLECGLYYYIVLGKLPVRCYGRTKFQNLCELPKSLLEQGGIQIKIISDSRHFMCLEI
jgi:hypothetical protein